GIPECQGEVVSFLDGDDWWKRHKLSSVIPILSADREIGTVGHGNITVFGDGREFVEVLKEGHRFSLHNVEGARMLPTRKNLLRTRSPIRSRILRKLLPVPEAIRIEADEFVFTMSAAFGEVEILPEALFYYRLHAANNYSQHGFNPESVRRKQ